MFDKNSKSGQFIYPEPILIFKEFEFIYIEPLTPQFSIKDYLSKKWAMFELMTLSDIWNVQFLWSMNYSTMAKTQGLGNFFPHQKESNLCLLKNAKCKLGNFQVQVEYLTRNVWKKYYKNLEKIAFKITRMNHP